MNTKKTWLIGLMLGLASCGGEGPGLADRGGNGTTNVADSSGQTTTVNSVQLLASSPQLQSDDSSKVTLSAIVKNADNQVVEGVEVVFSATSGTLVVGNSVTSNQGIASAELSTGKDPTNRTITATATVGSLSDAVDVDVIGTKLNIQGPSSLVNGEPGSYTVTLSDSGGKGIAGQPISVASSNGNTLSDPAPVTDSNGRVNVTLTGSNSGTDTVSASALPGSDATPSVSTSMTVSVSSDSFRFTTPANGAEVSLGSSETVAVRWEKQDIAQVGETIRFAATRGTLTNPATGATGSAVNAATDASGDATVTITSTTSGNAVITATNDENTSVQRSIEFVATNPASVSLQPDPAVIAVDESSVITAVVMDAANNRVKNAIVEFTLTDNTGGSLSTASAITDSQGRAQTVYTASSVTSADGGVTVSASVIGGSNPTATTSLTVSGRALFINFGTGNTIEENSTDTYYIKNYVMMVSDSSGAGVANQTVNLSVLSDTYLKGHMVGDPPVRKVEAICQNEDLAPFNGVLDPGEDQNRSEYPEDTNSNGVLDTGEDVNGNGFLDRDPGWGNLEPGNRALISPGEVTTDSDGLAEFQLMYPQDHALWLNVTLTAKATVSGTESVRSQRVLLPMSAGDEKNPPNFYSPFGTDFYLQDNCTDEDSATAFY